MGEHRTTLRPKREPLYVGLSREDLRRLDAIAERRDQSRASVARGLIHEALAAATEPDRADQ